MTRVRALITCLLAGSVYCHELSAAAISTTTNPSAPASTTTTGAARWLEQSTFIVSSLETGRIGYVEAAGGDEFGYAYRYALTGQPDGVSVDPDTGILSVTKPLAAGKYSFNAVVANLRVPSKVATFPITLDVKQGVTANRTGDQILHKVYSIDSGEYGKPNGQDYTNVLMNIRKAVIQDQTAAGDGNLRATIYFRRGNRYDYTNNKWPVGMQYVTVQPDPGYNQTGARARFRNVQGSFNFDSEVAVLKSGGGSVFDLLAGYMKINSPKIYTVKPGSNTVRLKKADDAANIMVGRWYAVGSYDQQVGGFPPNIRYFEYVKVAAVSGDTVTLDRNLRHLHREDYFEQPSNLNSMGVARLIPMDVGGAGGLLPKSDTRLTIRQTFRDIEFVTNPSTKNPSNAVVYIMNAIDASFENCVMPRPVPTMVAHVQYVGGSFESSEPDKLIETLIYDGVTAGDSVEATGEDLFLVRNSKASPMRISPRQLRIINSTMDASTDTYLGYPLGWSFNGPVLDVDLRGTTFRVRSGGADNSDKRVMPGIERASLNIGADASWKGNQLIIPSNSRAFLKWEVWLFEGMVVSTDGAPANWGVVRTLSSPPDGSAIWADIQWIGGTKPMQGQLNGGRGHGLTIDENSKLEGKARWGGGSGGFMRQKVPASFGPWSYDLPPGYPASGSGL